MRKFLVAFACRAAVTSQEVDDLSTGATHEELDFARSKWRKPGCQLQAHVGHCLVAGCFMQHGNASCHGTHCVCDPGYCSTNGWFCERIGLPGPDISKADKCTGEDISGVYYDLHDANYKIIQVDATFSTTITPPALGSKYYIDGIGRDWIVKPDHVGPIDEHCVVHDVDFNVPNKPAPPPGNVTAVFARTPLLNISWIKSCNARTVGNSRCGKTGMYSYRQSPEPVLVLAFGSLEYAGNVWVRVADVPVAHVAAPPFANAHFANGTCMEDSVVGKCLLVGCGWFSRWTGKQRYSQCHGTQCHCKPGYCSVDGFNCIRISRPTPTITKSDDCNGKIISGVYHDLHDANNKIIRVDEEYHMTITPPRPGTRYYVDGIGKNWIVRQDDVGRIDDNCVVNNLNFRVKNKPAPPPGNVSALFVETPLEAISYVRSCGPKTVGNTLCGQTGAYPNLANPEPVVSFVFGALSNAGNVWVRIADVPNDSELQVDEVALQLEFDMREARLDTPKTASIVLTIGLAAISIAVVTYRRQRALSIEQPLLLA